MPFALLGLAALFIGSQIDDAIEAKAGGTVVKPAGASVIQIAVVVGAGALALLAVRKLAK